MKLTLESEFRKNHGRKLNELYTNEVENMSKINDKNCMRLYDSWKDVNFRF